MSKSKKETNLKLVKGSKNDSSKVSALSPREIVSELDRYVIGQKDAKKAVAVALRNRWRRQALTDEMRDEVLPKNILMIGPTGVGKTEISRRLSKLAEAPFIKVEATRFTEVGYVGRDVEQIVRDLVEIAIAMERERKRKEVKAKAELKAEEKVLDALVGSKASVATRESFRKRLRNGDLDNKEIEIEVQDTSSGVQSFEIPGMPGGNVGMVNLGDILGKSMGGKKGKKKKMSVKESHGILVAQESDKMIEEDKIIKEAKKATEENGIVFLDEIDKVSARSDRVGGDVSREGVQRDLLPLIEGTTVSTKHGPIKTDHILFIASGAFQLAKPSDLLPELQGRLPIRVELNALNEDDFKRILKDVFNQIRIITVDKIQNIVSNYFNISLTDMLSQRRARPLARPRQIAMYLAKKMTSRSLPEIGRRFANRDHTTVIHAVKTISRLSEQDDEMKKNINQIKSLLIEQ